MAKMYLGNQPVRIIERSKNQLIPFPYVQNGIETSGGKFVVNADGSIIAKGTPTGYIGFKLVNKIEAKNDMVYMLYSKNSANVSGNLAFYTANGTLLSSIGTTVNTPYKVSKTDYPELGYIDISVKRTQNNAEMKGTLYPMLNEGETAKPFEPYNQYFRIRTGANIRNPANLIPLPYDIETTEQDGLTLTVGKGGEITLNGTATKNSFFYIKRELNIPKGTYTFSGNSRPSADYAYYLYNPNKDKYYHQYSNNPTTFTLNEEQRLLLMIRANANITLDNVVIYPMLFEGETTKPYYIQD